MIIYGLHGWRGLTMTAIARDAAVGKALLYSRYSSPAEVLRSAFARHVPAPTSEPTTVRDLLVDEALHRGRLYLGEYALAARRIQVDALAGIDTAQHIEQEIITRTVLAMRSRIRRAMASGELPAHTSVTRLLDIVEGAILVHTSVATPELKAKVAGGLESYAHQLVEDQLRALACGQ